MRAIAVAAVALSLSLGPGLGSGCASAGKPPVPRLSQFHLPPETSIDVLLASTVDLSLTTPQVAELVKLQAELNEKVKPIREEMDQVRSGHGANAPPPGPQPGAPPPPPPPEQPLPPPLPPLGPGRWVGQVRSSGDVGVPRGPHERQLREPVPKDYEERRGKLEALIKQFDAEDQAAYERAASSFDEPQKAAARKLMEARAAERAKQAGGGP